MSMILNVINFFWKLGFNEEEEDIYRKSYQDDCTIALDMKNEILDYGTQIKVLDDEKTVFSQKNFIIMESINRLLLKGYKPSSIIIPQH